MIMGDYLIFCFFAFFSSVVVSSSSKGQAKTAYSKAVETCFLEQAKQAGVGGARQQPHDYFAHCSKDPKAQLGFEEASKQGAHGKNNCGGAVLGILLPRVAEPDSRADGTSYCCRAYDAKTCGHRIFNKSKKSPCGYGAPLCTCD